MLENPMIVGITKSLSQSKADLEKGCQHYCEKLDDEDE